MKNKIFLLACSFALIASSLVSAQNVQVINRNATEQFSSTLKTTDATATYIDSFTFKKNEGGILESTVIGFGTDTAQVVTGTVYVRFIKHRDTLTLGTPAYGKAVVSDAALGSSTFTYVAVGKKIYLRVTGKAATPITWTSITKRKSVWYRE